MAQICSSQPSKIREGITCEAYRSCCTWKRIPTCFTYFSIPSPSDNIMNLIRWCILLPPPALVVFGCALLICLREDATSIMLPHSRWMPVHYTWSAQKKTSCLYVGGDWRKYVCAGSGWSPLCSNAEILACSSTSYFWHLMIGAIRGELFWWTHPVQKLLLESS